MMADIPDHGYLAGQNSGTASSIDYVVLIQYNQAWT